MPATHPLLGACLLAGLVSAGCALAEDLPGRWADAGATVSFAGLVRDGFELKGSALDGGVLVTFWIKPERTDPVSKDFVGRPVVHRAELVRCVERQDGQGRFRLDFCEVAE